MIRVLIVSPAIIRIYNLGKKTMIKILYFTITLKAAICIGASSPKKSPKGSNLCINGNYLYDWDEDCKILTLVESEDSICRFNQDRKNCKFYHILDFFHFCIKKIQFLHCL